ncbi:hypothetical protein E2C01_026420 [Portunus trituberculatus]|uniref:Uncharacterized protein n=1 Tax=Portunus trituberculatus TaxID=210409 RepID=A0A5B7EFC9_PORTR|nr:hypothetical protein [Portunus trituberculatus]
MRSGGDKRGRSPSSILPSVHASLSTFTSPLSWRCVKATVLGNHEIPDRVAMRIPITVPDAPVNSDICFTGPCKLQSLAVESTLSAVQEGLLSSVQVPSRSCECHSRSFIMKCSSECSLKKPQYIIFVSRNLERNSKFSIQSLNNLRTITLKLDIQVAT